MTFLSILLSAISDDEPVFESERCIAHPASAHMTVCENDILEYAASVGNMLVYLKCVDDFKDNHSIKGLIGAVFCRLHILSAKKKYPGIYKRITENLNRLGRLEKENCSDTDMVSDCFAKITQTVFEYNKSGDEKRILGQLGYDVGRWIYIIDAFADIRDDFKKKSYNPFLAKKSDDISLDGYIEQLSEAAEVSLTYTLSNISAAYELLNIKRNDDVLRNIIYIGMLSKQKSILAGKIKEKNRKGQKHESI